MKKEIKHEIKGEMKFQKNSLTGIAFKTEKFGNFTFSPAIVPKEYNPQGFDVSGEYQFIIRFTSKPGPEKEKKEKSSAVKPEEKKKSYSHGGVHK